MTQEQEHKTLLPELKTQNHSLRYIIKQIWWMARRYADGRSSCATSTYNDAIRAAQRLGIDFWEECDGKRWIIDGTPWARDGMGVRYSGLTQEEYDMGEPLDKWAIQVPTEEVKELRQALETEKLKVERAKEGLTAIVNVDLSPVVISDEPWLHAQAWAKQTLKELEE